MAGSGVQLVITSAGASLAILMPPVRWLWMGMLCCATCIICPPWEPSSTYSCRAGSSTRVDVRRSSAARRMARLPFVRILDSTKAGALIGTRLPRPCSSRV